ncbi:DNA-directed RNA polymerase III subunit RPC8 isoform X2 [Phyllobates terribilis]|uniref:DNA-directed RNA polymerase III subunit RPC8 isoform X2 n=1 Tax=Phyllobates terribilis TaxID=111132 RepID=UPI003CCA7182
MSVRVNTALDGSGHTAACGVCAEITIRRFWSRSARDGENQFPCPPAVTRVWALQHLLPASVCDFYITVAVRHRGRPANQKSRGLWQPLPASAMFVLVEMVDTVRTTPWQFERKLNDSIAEELNKKLANKVVYNVGLCICLYDITKLEDSYIFPGDGASHTKVHFRYVVFHPFLDEILMGKIKGCSPEGVHVSLGFFDDIVIPPESLQQPAKFDEAEQVWVWEYETEEGAHDLYMDIGEDIRFRVVDETFIDTSPTGPSTTESSPSTATEEPQRKEAPYTLAIIC